MSRRSRGDCGDAVVTLSVATVQLRSMSRMQPESQPPAPPVVAVVITCDPGYWFEQALASLAEQDYPNLSVLVLDAGSVEDPTPVVAGTLPGAFVRRLGERRAFGPACNEVIAMVEGASHLLLCHDDVALAPDSIRLMVEEAFRSNAGIATPKYVQWDAPDRLLAVGATTDRVGVIRDLVDPGEMDQQQHDSVRDVLVAPGGATLVRADLFSALGGFRSDIEQEGADLDLSWRARVAGARIVTVPAARVRHLRATESGSRVGSRSAMARRRRTTTEDTTRIRSMLICYRWFDLLANLPLALLWLLGESFTDTLSSRPRDAASKIEAFAAAFGHPRRLWTERRTTQKSRVHGELPLRRLQARGNSRLRDFLRSRAQVVLSSVPHPALAGDDAPADFDDVEGPIPAAEPIPVADLAGRAEAAVRSRGRILLVAALVLVIVIGSRNLIGHDLPGVGQTPRLPGWSEIWRTWWSQWQSSGLGSADPSSPAIGLLGLVSTLLLGATGTAQHVVVLGPLLLGPLGAYRAARWWGSRRGQVAAMVLYAIVPVPYNSVALGHWSGLVAFAAAPWVLSWLIRVGDDLPLPPTAMARIAGRVVALSLLVAAVASVAPSFLYVVPLIGAALLAGSALAGRPWRGVRMLGVAVGATAGAFVTLLPWSASVIASSAAVRGPGLGSSGRLGFGAVLRFQTGPFGHGWLGWLILAAASLPLLVGRGWRLAWASRLWSVAIVCFVVAWAGGRGWFPALPVEVLLAPAGAALAGCAALGVAAFELDLPGYKFGWRQVAAGVAGIALAVASVSLVIDAAGGRWNLPSADANSVLTFLPSTQAGDYRVLWVGAPDALPLASRELYPGMGYATSYDGDPSLADMWIPGSDGATGQLAVDLNLVQNRLTTKLGHLLAPASVRFIVVPNNTGPYGSGGRAEPVPGALLTGFGLQTDLQSIDVGDPDYSVYENAAWLPARSVLASGASTVAAASTLAGRRPLQELDLSASPPALSGRRETESSGVVAGGATIFVSESRSERWRLDVGGVSLSPHPAFGWAMQYQVPASVASSGAHAQLAYHPSLLLDLAQWVEVIILAGAVTVIVIDRRRRYGEDATPEVADPQWFEAAAPVESERRIRLRREGRSSGPEGNERDEVWSDV